MSTTPFELPSPATCGSWDYSHPGASGHVRTHELLRDYYLLPQLPQGWLYRPGSRYVPWDEHTVTVTPTDVMHYPSGLWDCSKHEQRMQLETWVQVQLGDRGQS